MKLYLFNPDTDLALAVGSRNYTASGPVRAMMADLAFLPAWYADEGAAVLAAGSCPDAFVAWLERDFSRTLSFVSADRLRHLPQDWQVEPWGWNATLCRRLLSCGLPASALPSAGWLQRFRELSGRRTACQVLDALALDGCCGESCVCVDVAQCQAAFRRWRGQVVFKAPYSSSGKGLLWCRGEFSAKSGNWCGRVLQEQGYVTASPIYDKVLDFAMEFVPGPDGGMRFAGYSLFATDGRGAYSHNELLSDGRVAQVLGQYVPASLLHAVRDRLVQTLSGLQCGGVVGVDMMICRGADSASWLLHPCVEINFRRTMGMVAHDLTERYVAPSSHGRMVIEHFASAAHCRQFHEARRRAMPLVLEGGRVVCGYMPLVPVLEDTCNLAFIEVAR